MNRVLRGSVVLAAAVGFLSCKGDPTSSLRGGVDHLSATPSKLFITQGTTAQVVVQAVDAQGNQVATNFTASDIGTGIAVVQDSTFQTVFEGDSVRLPGAVPRARFKVTANQAVATTFRINAGGQHLDIPVSTIPTTAAAIFAPTTPAIGDTLTITAPASLRFTPASTATFAAGPCAVTSISTATDSLTLKCIPFPGSTGDATLSAMAAAYATPDTFSVTAVSGVTVPAAPNITIAPATPQAGDTVTVTLSGLFRFTPSGGGKSTCDAGATIATAVTSITADSLTLKCLVGPGAFGPFKVTGVQLSGRSVVGPITLETAAAVTTAGLPSFQASKGTAAIGDNITITAPGRYRFLPTTTLATPSGASTSAPAISADSLTMSFLIGPNWPGVQAELDSVVITGAADLGKFAVVTDSLLATPALTQFPASLSNVKPAAGEVITMTAGTGFAFAAGATVTEGGVDAPVLSVSGNTLTFVGIPLTGRGKPQVSGVVLTSNPALPMNLTAGVYLTAPPPYAGTDLFSTAPTITIPATGQTAYIADQGVFLSTGDCAGAVGFPCRMYKFTTAGAVSFNITASWSNNGDLGIYFSGDGFAGFPLFTTACDSHGDDGLGETCQVDVTGAGTYFMEVISFTAAYPPPDNVDPTHILIQLDGL